MNDNKSKFPIGELPQSASPSSLTVDEIAEKKRNQKKSLIKMGAMGILTLILLIFSSLSWFTMNTQVESGGMSIKTSASPFELEVKGDDIENDGDYDKADSEYEYGEDQNLTPTSYQTSGGHGKIIWRKDGSSEDDGHYTNGLEPNSHGKLTFWVVPNSTGTLDIDFSFNVRGFIGSFTVPSDPNDDPDLIDLYEINDTLTIAAANGLLKDNDDLANKKAALEYIQGHILFFSDYNTTTGYYSGFLGTARSVRFGNCINPATGTKYNSDNPVAVTAGEKYQVTIYWKWANTLEQMVLDETSPKKDNPLFVSTNTTDRAAIFTYLNGVTNNAMDNKVFKDVTNTVITTDLGYIQNNTPGQVNNALTELTNAYNNADSFIGNNVDYILIEMNASPK